MIENLMDDQENYSNVEAKKLDKKISNGMKLYRYMSIEEFIKMCGGIHLTYTKDPTRKTRSNSKGFCFIGENTTFTVYYETEEGFESEDYTFTPERCYDFLSGIVSRDMLVEFQATNNIDVFERIWSIC